MAVFNKPQYNTVWASAGVQLKPADGKISQGWVVEIPPYEYDNWVQGRQDGMLAHVNQFGIPVWDASTEYQINRSYAQGPVSGTIFRALRTHVGANPETDTSGAWQIAFNSSGDSLMKAYNLSDVPDKALARTNLGITTTAQYDARYLMKSLNLADVPDKAIARTNLGITPDSVYDAKYLHRANNLSDIVDKAAARANLGISESGQSGVDYLFKNANLSDLQDKPTARTNLEVYSKSEVYNIPQINDLLPAGEICYFARTSPPPNFLEANGAAVSRTVYARLFSAIGTSFGPGNGSTTFNLPDLRGVFLRSWDNGKGVDVGRAFGSTQESQNISHTHTASTGPGGGHLHGVNITTSRDGEHNHTVVDPGHGHTVLGSPGQGQGAGGGGNTVQQSAGTSLTNVVKTNVSLNQSGLHNHAVVGNTAAITDHTHPLTIGPGGGGTEARPVNIAMLVCIRT